MTEQEQYNELLKIEEKLLYYNKYNEVSLSESDYDVLKTLYNVYFNKFNKLNVTCGACVSEMLNVCISRYSALKKQFDKVKEVEPEIEAVTPEVEAVEEVTPEVKKKGEGK